jgi:hypothetical protein
MATRTAESATTAAIVPKRHQPRKKGKVEGSVWCANMFDVLYVW